MKKPAPAFKAIHEYDIGPLATCLARLGEQQALLAKVRTALPEALAGHVLHTVLSGSRLLLYVDSAAWASQIRFFRDAILALGLQAGRQSVNDVQLRILQAEAVERVRRANLPTPETAERIAAENGAEGDELAAALNRLGATLRRRLRER